MIQRGRIAAVCLYLAIYSNVGTSAIAQTYLIVDDINNPTMEVQIEFASTVFLKQIKTIGPNQRSVDGDASNPEPLFSVRFSELDLQSPPTPSSTKMTIFPDDSPNNNWTVQSNGILATPGGRHLSINAFKSFTLDWGASKIDNVIIEFKVFSGNGDSHSPATPTFHGQWKDMVQWRLRIKYENTNSNSWADKIRFPRIKLNVPDCDCEHWFLQNIDSHDFARSNSVYYTTNQPNWFKLFPSRVCDVDIKVDIPLMESNGFEAPTFETHYGWAAHPAGKYWDTEGIAPNHRQQLLQFNGWYFHGGSKETRDFLMYATDDMWGHYKRFLMALVRESPPSGGSWRSGTEFVRFMTEHLGIRRFNRNSPNVEDRSPFSMFSNSPDEALPCYGVYTGFVKAKGDSYWYDACEKYRELLDGTPNDIQGKRPTLYSQPYRSRPTDVVLSGPGNLFITQGDLSNNPVFRSGPAWNPDLPGPDTTSFFGRCLDDTYNLWDFFNGNKTQPEQCNGRVYNFIPRDGWAPIQGHPVYSTYQGVYPQTPNPSWQFSPNGVYDQCSVFSNLISCDPSTLNGTWRPFGARFTPYLELEAVHPAMRTYVDSTHPLGGHIYRLNNLDYLSRVVPDISQTPAIVGMICLGLDPSTGNFSLTPPITHWFINEFYVRDVAEPSTPSNLSALNVCGLYTDHMSGPGVRACWDDGSTYCGLSFPASKNNVNSIHAHSNRPVNICEPGYFPAPGGSYHAFGRRNMVDRAKAVIDGKIISSTSRVPRDPSSPFPQDAAYILGEAPEEYTAGSVDAVGGGYNYVSYVMYGNADGQARQSQTRYWRESLNPPLYDFVYHDRQSRFEFVCFETAGPILEKDQTFNFFYSDSAPDDIAKWMDWMCLWRAYALCRGAHTGFYAMNYAENVRWDGDWTGNRQIPLMIQRDPGNPNLITYARFDPQRDVRSKRVWDEYLLYVYQNWSLLQYFQPFNGGIDITKSRLLRPPDRTTHANIDHSAVNPIYSHKIKQDAIYNSHATYSWNDPLESIQRGGYQNLKNFFDFFSPLPDYQGVYYSGVDKVTVSVYSLPPSLNGILVVFSNWHHQSTGASFRIDPAWYGLSGSGLINVVYFARPSDLISGGDGPYGVWSYTAAKSLNLNSDLNITFHQTPQSGNDFQVFDGSPGAPNWGRHYLRERETVALLIYMAP